MANIVCKEIIKKLKSKKNPKNIAGMARFGMNTENRLGISMPYLRKLAKEICRVKGKTVKNHSLALELWKSGIAEARLLAYMVDDPCDVTEKQMDSWVKDFNSWDICDGACMMLFDKTPFAIKKIREWSHRKEEYVKRASYALIACVAWHDKEAEDRVFIKLLPLIKQGATDERNFVRKAVNWALRHIGKRNLRLNKIAIAYAKELRKIDSKSARWIAADAIRELESEPIQKRLRS
jgi:3-methyladenine DNA glycosylase AlkD